MIQNRGCFSLTEEKLFCQIKTDKNNLVIRQSIESLYLICVKKYQKANCTVL